LPDFELGYFLVESALNEHAEIFKDYKLHEDRTHAYLAECVREGLALIAEDEGEFIGVLLASVQDHIFMDVSLAEVGLVYVMPEHRKQGAGVLLLKEYIRWCHNIDIRPTMTTSCGLRLPGLDRFIKTFGFKSIGQNYLMAS